MAKANAGKSLSKASPYEALFGVRHRKAGRPTGDVAPVFGAVSEEVGPVLAGVAKRRAYAVVHEESRERLREVFAAELKVLRRRGEEQVLEDVAASSAVSAGSAAPSASSAGASVGGENRG